MSQWLRELILGTAKIVLPAILIAIIGQFFILQWQHRYWRLQKIITLQDETYRKARSILVGMVFLVERVFRLATEKTADAATDESGRTRELIAMVLSRSAQDQEAMAEPFTRRSPSVLRESTVHHG